MAEKTEKRPTIDPRVQQLMRGRPLNERLDIYRASRDMDPEEIEAIIALDAPMQSMVRGVDINAEVAGRPLHNWIGKTRDQIINELRSAGRESADAEMSEIETVLTDAGFAGTLNPGGPLTAAMYADDRQRRNVTVPSAPPVDDAGVALRSGAVSGATAGGANDLTFGDDQIPLADLPNSYGELTEIDGIGDATANRVLDLKEKAGITVTRKRS